VVERNLGPAGGRDIWLIRQTRWLVRARQYLRAARRLTVTFPRYPPNPWNPSARSDIRASDVPAAAAALRTATANRHHHAP
jgi:hypothetical protein